MHKSFVITATSANRTSPARVAVVSRADVVRVEKLIARLVINPTLLHVSHLSDVGIDEAVTQIDITRGTHAQ
jgi:hypothetical protein